MTIAAKHLDPLVGLDTHIILIPTPAGPVPTPLPHPYVGMVIDPMDYAPVIGATTYINGLPRGQAGSSGKALPPHIPMGGPFAKPPSNESEIFMGSATVLVDGEPQSFLGLPVLSCQDIGMPAPPRPKKKSVARSLMLPVTVVLSIPMGALVLIGGPPTISMTAMAMKAGMAGLKKLAKLGPIAKLIKKGSNKIHALASKLMKKLPIGDALRNKVHKKICSITGHPVDIATGKVFTEAVDLELPGAIPFRWERTWFSTSTYTGPLGHGWHHSYDLCLHLVEPGVVLLRTSDGRHIGLPPLKQGQEQYDRAEKLTFLRDAAGYAVRDREGLVYRFAPVAGRPSDQHPLGEIQDSVGNTVRLHYDAWGRLAQIVDCAGRLIEIVSDAAGHIVALTAPHPEVADQRVYVARYAYDGWGNLATVTDALGHSVSFVYQQHLLVKETDRNGLSFYFAYDRNDAQAKCVRTWGDGGIYDHKLTYDTDAGVTVVENSLGHRTMSFHRGGLVVKTVDALGNTSTTEYSEHNEVLVETDPLGQKTSSTYDERGNLVEKCTPDGATATFEYDESDRLLRAVDPLGGEWKWSYDTQHRLVERVNPLGEKTRFEWGGPRLSAFVDPVGGRTHVVCDAAGNIAAVTTPDGASTRWDYDAHGRVLGSTDPNGNVRRRERDVLGRIVRVSEPDGNVRELAYDGEGNVLRATDRQHDVRFEYRGMNRLAARIEGETRVEFHYDSEDRLIAIKNEHGLAYRFVLGPTGSVDEEHGFDGLARKYTRDAGGQVIETLRPSGEKTVCTYDPVGRVIAIENSDGTKETYGYRADGELVVASNEHVTVALERDALGRVVNESQGEDWVATEYDALGLRRSMRSSKGLFQTIRRNDMGDVVGVGAELGAPGQSGAIGATLVAPFGVAFHRDRMGLELERSLPGGVRAKWHRDSLGRPLRHEIWRAEEPLDAKQYIWDVANRLKRVIDSLLGPVDYTYDALGKLAAAVYADGHIDLRMPDAVGNLFRTQDRGDRKYGPAGQLLEARGARGVTRYAYDPEGRLAQKIEPDGSTWTYRWNGAGMLVKVVRPDGAAVVFAYDALGRRISKTYRGKMTRWIWDANVPLHEWVERDEPSAVDPTQGEPAQAANMPEVLAKAREDLLRARPAQGPPFLAPTDDALLGTKKAPITWLFEPESFAPLAKLVAGEHFAIVTDHLGTPARMYDASGNETWRAEIDTYGNLRDVRGDRAACPFRWPGQYEDTETGLSYNRFRYYDPDAGRYLSQDPARTSAGIRAYGYPANPLLKGDPLGLAEQVLTEGTVYRGGSKQHPNLTPRPPDPSKPGHTGDVEGPQRGLSTFQNIEDAVDPGQKAQQIDIAKLGPDLEAVLDGDDGHVSIRPKNDPDGAKLRDWAAQRGKPNALAGQVEQAIVDPPKKRPKCS